MRRHLLTLALLAATVALFVVCFVQGSARGTGEEKFAGTDSLATEQIQQVAPGYEPWFAPFFEPASGEIESGLFALQAGLGGTVLGFAVGALWGRRHPGESPR